MKTIDIFTLGTPPAFQVDISSDNYWSERCAYEMSNMFHDAANEGFTLSQEEQSDLDSVLSGMTTFIGSLGTWTDSAVAAQSSGLPVPALPSLPEIIAGISLPPVVWYIGKMALEIVLTLLKKKFEGGNDFSELAGLFRAAFIGEDDFGEFSVLNRALLTDTPSGEKTSILFFASAVPIEIMINRTGQIEAVSFNSEM
jgi:hypothetical protein